MENIAAPEVLTALVPDVVERSRKVSDDAFLDASENWPALFSCSYRGCPSTGFVAPNGVVFIMPHVPGARCGPLVCRHFREVDRLTMEAQITDIRWEWQVTRRPTEDVEERKPCGS